MFQMLNFVLSKNMHKNIDMKENNELLTILNSLLEDILTSINKFMVHSEICENSGYSKLHLAIQKQAMDQMLLAERLIERIGFLNGSDTLSKLSTLIIGKTVADVIGKNLNDEPHPFRVHTEAIKLADEINDQSTVELLKKILTTEEGQNNWAEIQRQQIEKMGMAEYLVSQNVSMVN